MSTPTLSQGQRLAAQAAEAAEVRSWQTHPDVVALRVEKARSVVDRFIWTGMILGLLFTMTNVQQFAAAGAVVGSLAWCAAWLLDPMVSLVLLGVLRAEQVTARWQVVMGPWPRVAKWSLLAGTYVMNTWSAWAAGSPSAVVLHSMPVLTVFVAAEAVTDCQDKLTECVHRAHAWATQRAEQRVAAERETQAVEGEGRAHPATMEGTRPGGLPRPPTPSRGDHCGSAAIIAPDQAKSVSSAWGVVSSERATTRTARPTPARQNTRTTARRRKPARRKSGGRVLFADYLATARQALTPDTEITPAWAREVTGCSRGLSSRLAAELRTEHHRAVPADPAPPNTSTDTAEDDPSDQPAGLEGEAA